MIAAGRKLFGGAGDPRIADIVAMAGVSLEAFYRYFGSKSAFIAAVADDGTSRVVTYVRHKTEGADTPEQKLRAVVDAVMRQAASPELAAASRNLLGTRSDSTSVLTFRGEIADLLSPVLGGLGSTDAPRDARIAATAVIGAVEDHIWSDTRPTSDDIDRLVDFIARAVRR
nr:TetR/AcrR family transcriptional regulator [Gordonia humi]